ncbi:DNA polymerase delta subunit 2-like [Prorops nasuta]|uniref:DNA polymerase delta subunit 2-like n=1 Tax=Prorops nasuta TaxID=863751 RepID=UPI0034D014BA
MVVPTNDNSQNDVHVIEKKCIPYKDLSVFSKGDEDYFKQFAHIYAKRLEQLAHIVATRAERKWESVQVVKLSELKDYEGKQCILIGTMFKHQPWKPSILRELSDDHQLTMPPPRSTYCSDEDQLFLEDMMLRIKLVGNNVNINEAVTGTVCAVLGSEQQDGSFEVEDWCFPGCIPKPIASTTSTKGKLIIVSGLNLSETAETLAVSVFSELLCGLAGNATVQEEEASVVRVIFAGNTVKYDTNTQIQTGHSEIKAQELAISKDIVSATTKTDKFLAELAKCCCITLMPGQYDPTNIMMPQKPLHPCLLPQSFRLKSFNGATNPMVGKAGERIVMGSSGQPIEDIMKTTANHDSTPLEWLEKSLEWRHMCPTAPDTLPAIPYYDEDLFLMKNCPDIYFVGNTDAYETKLYKGQENQVVRLISVPRFCTTHTAVMVDLESLETNPITFCK